MVFAGFQRNAAEGHIRREDVGGTPIHGGGPAWIEISEDANSARPEFRTSNSTRLFSYRTTFTEPLAAESGLQSGGRLSTIVSLEDRMWDLEPQATLPDHWQLAESGPAHSIEGEDPDLIDVRGLEGKQLVEIPRRAGRFVSILNDVANVQRTNPRSIRSRKRSLRFHSGSSEKLRRSW